MDETVVESEATAPMAMTAVDDRTQVSVVSCFFSNRIISLFDIISIIYCLLRHCTALYCSKYKPFTFSSVRAKTHVADARDKRSADVHVGTRNYNALINARAVQGTLRVKTSPYQVEQIQG